MRVRIGLKIRPLRQGPTAPVGTTDRIASGRLLRKGKLTREGTPQPAVPRISRLMALAIHMQELVDRGEVGDYAELARLAHVSRARITQIMNLTLLAPDVQEAILFLPATNGGRGAVGELAEAEEGVGASRSLRARVALGRCTSRGLRWRAPIMASPWPGCWRFLPAPPPRTW